jgi:hypothetical protein
MILLALIMVELGGAVGQNLNSMLISDLDTVYKRTVSFLTGLRCLLYHIIPLAFLKRKSVIGLPNILKTVYHVKINGFLDCVQRPVF